MELNCSACAAATSRQAQIPDGASHTLDDYGDALPHADAHGAERITASPPLQFIGGRGQQPGAAHTKRMPQSDGTAVRIDVFGIVGSVAHERNAAHMADRYPRAGIRAGPCRRRR